MSTKKCPACSAYSRPGEEIHFAGCVVYEQEHAGKETRRVGSLSTTQNALLKRINRCEKGCFIEAHERRSAEILAKRELIKLKDMIAYPLSTK